MLEVLMDQMRKATQPAFEPSMLMTPGQYLLVLCPRWGWPPSIRQRYVRWTTLAACPDLDAILGAAERREPLSAPIFSGPLDHPFPWGMGP